MARVLNKKKERKVTEEKLMQKRSRNWSDEFTVHVRPKSAGSHQELGERHGMNSPSEPPEGIYPPDILISNSKCCFKATSF